MSRSSLLLFGFVCVSMISQISFSQETFGSDDSDQVKKIAEFLNRSLQKLEFSMASQPKTKIKPVATHAWTNDTRDAYSQGMLSIVSNEGLPIAAVAVYIWRDQLIYEFDMLCREPIFSDFEGRTVWQPTRGIEFKPVPSAPRCDSTEKARLRQMKASSLEFDVTMLGWRKDRSDREELRRMPRELFRYKSQDSKVIDGAIFAYVTGTDPEALLILEAVKESGNSEPTWQFAFVRQTSGGLEGRHQNNVVWQAPEHPPRRDRSLPGFDLKFPFNAATDLVD